MVDNLVHTIFVPKSDDTKRPVIWNVEKQSLQLQTLIQAQ